MIAALSALERFYPQLENAEVDDKKQNFQAMQISSKNSFLQLLSSHPPLKDRIQSLKESQLR